MLQKNNTFVLNKIYKFKLKIYEKLEGDTKNSTYILNSSIVG